MYIKKLFLIFGININVNNQIKIFTFRNELLSISFVFSTSDKSTLDAFAI